MKDDESTKDDDDGEDFLRWVDQKIANLDQGVSYSADESAVWGQIRDKFTDKYLYDSSDECIGHISIERTSSQEINVSAIIDSKTKKMSYQAFKTWLTSNKYHIGEKV